VNGPRGRVWAATAIGFVAVTLGLLAVRDRLDKVHVALALLLVVLGSSAAGGRRLGIVTAGAGFLIFNYFFLPPYYTLVIADPFDWFVLVAFLLTGIVAAQLLFRAQTEAERARHQAAEVVRLSAAAERAEALREADKLKDALLATVSHDIRTPLTTIRALAQDIGAEGDERAITIAEEVDRLNRFVADLLDLSQLKAGAIPMSIALNAAEDLMGAALQRVSGISRGRDLRASLDPSDPILLGRFDFTHALRILGNLLENALKYAPADSTIEFTVRRDGTQLRFDVADRGPGIPADARERIFEPFIRGGATSASPDARGGATGAGLGLAIARGLAIAQGGSLTHASREGGGSVFTLHLPAADVTDLELEAPRA
jgi:K+-sensing histidine kinase KdpD